MSEFKIPTETVKLPSKGLLYPKESPLAKGEIEMKYMTAKEEDILTNANYIRNNTVIDKLLQSMIVTPIDYSELLVGDKNAILITARILGYGKDYTVIHNGKEQTIDLSKLEDKKVDESLFRNGNEFTFNCPVTNNVITFKLLTHGDEQKIDAEIKGLQKVSPTTSSDVSTRLKHIITSVNGSREQKDIRAFADTMLAQDARALRKYYNEIQPDVDMRFIPNDENYVGEGVEFSPGVDFFWPDFGV